MWDEIRLEMISPQQLTQNLFLGITLDFRVSNILNRRSNIQDNVQIKIPSSNIVGLSSNMSSGCSNITAGSSNIPPRTSNNLPNFSNKLQPPKPQLQPAKKSSTSGEVLD